MEKEKRRKKKEGRKKGEKKERRGQLPYTQSDTIADRVDTVFLEDKWKRRR